MFKFFVLYFSFIACSLFSQSPDFIWPLDSPWVITGDYGELRPNHFHDGLDLSTNGVIGKQVYTAAAGYVSRVKTSATGYGKCIYVTHPNGKVTVYGHLSAYSLK